MVTLCFFYFFFKSVMKERMEIGKNATFLSCFLLMLSKDVNSPLKVLVGDNRTTKSRPNLARFILQFTLQSILIQRVHRKLLHPNARNSLLPKKKKKHSIPEITNSNGTFLFTGQSFKDCLRIELPLEQPQKKS